MMDEIFNFLEALASGELLRKDTVDTTYLTNGNTLWLIDTCETADCGWETAIQIEYKGSSILDWVVVERYPDKSAAEMGHRIWCDDIEKNQTTYFYSVQDKCIYGVDIVE